MFPRALTGVSLVAFLGLVAFLCAFKVDDVDVWWHLKAGELMVRTGAWIRTDPFAYTREGQPYLASYEWLAQIILYLVYAAGGATALIALRTALVALTFLLLSVINRQALWIALPVALFGAARVLPSLTDRPHLFTYALLAAFLLVATQVLDDGGPDAVGGPKGPPYVRRLGILLVVLEVLWVNLHGGAALLGIVVWGAVLLQVGWETRSPAGLKSGGYVLGGLLLAQLVFPNGASLAYLYHLLTDETRSFILEWQPRAWGPYLRDLAPWWIAALAAIAVVRRKLVFSLVTLLAFGALSRTAYRHEALFVMVATGLVMYQWRWLGAREVSARASAWLLSRAWRAAAVAVVIYLLAGVAVYSAWIKFGRYFQTYGYGSLGMAGRAAAFLNREGITGPMFNTYDLGADLLYHDRKVFVDTRNVDYGYAFLKRTFDAANDQEIWNGLDREYHFTHAVVWYAPFVMSPSLPYIRHLEHDPDWALVYMDDRTAVYLRETCENAATIAHYQYKLVTPVDLYTGDVIGRTPRARLGDLVEELTRLAAADPDSIQARLLLAQIYIQ